PSAVAEKNGLSWFQEASSVAEGKLDNIGTQSVKTISLDNFIEKRKIKPDLLKIDVEGAELKVLKGVENYLFEHKPLIVIETHGELIKDQCFNFLNKLGYTNFIPIDANSIEKASDFVIKP
ncbi:MAG: FkbM family methyltransferase, partial [Candidatus Thorarchaeota archaeon]